MADQNDPYAGISVDDIVIPVLPTDPKFMASQDPKKNVEDPYSGINVDDIKVTNTKVLPQVAEGAKTFGSQAYVFGNEVTGGMLDSVANIPSNYEKFVDESLKRVNENTGGGVDTLNSLIGDLTNSPEAAGIKAVGDTLWGATKAAVKAPFEAIAPVLDVSDRLAGTAVGYGIEGYQSMFGSKGNFMTDMAIRDIKQGLGGTENFQGIEVNAPRTLPVSLLKDIIQDPTTKQLIKFGQYLQSDGTSMTGDRTTPNVLERGLGEVIEGLAPGMGLAAGLVGSYYADPLSFTKIGKLTEEGMALSKEGNLSRGAAQQIAKGERSLFGVQFSDLTGEGSVVNLAPAKPSAVFVDKLQDAAIRFDSSKAGQAFRQYTTLPPFENIGEMGQSYVYSRNINKYENNQFQELVKNKFNSLGFDYANKEQRLDFRRYIENPAQYKPLFDDGRKYDQMFGHLDTELNKWANEARAQGINIADRSLIHGPADLGDSERYVPRAADFTKQQLYSASRMFEDSTEAEKAISDLGLANNGAGRGFSTGFLKSRSNLNTDKMNALMEEKFGVKDFFHDDIVKAYGDKIQDIRDTIETRKFANGVLEATGKSRLEWAQMKAAASERVAASRAEGLIPDLIDKRIAQVDLNSLTKVDESVGMNFAKATQKDPGNIFLPKADADFVSGLFKAPTQTQVASYMNSYMRAWKGSVFFNPGFIGRNAWENYTRAKSLGVSQFELGLGHSSYMFGKGKYAKYYPEFEAAEKPFGLASNITKSGDGGIVAPVDAADMENGLDRVHRGLYEMSARGTIGKWFKETKDAFKESAVKFASVRGPKDLADAVSSNPLYRFAGSANNKWENSFRFSYYSKLREAGYGAEQALKEMDKQFISYNIVRNKVIDNQKYIPFLNYMMKNAETSINLFGNSGRGAVTFAPGGSLERAVENWSGWDPNSIKRFKEIHGKYYTDSILGPILPGKDAMEKEKDYIKKFLNGWLNPNGDMAGFQLWSKLPSNYHGLMALDPTKANEMAGPMIKLGLMLGLGVGPDGAKIKASDDKDVGMTERLSAALDDNAQAFIPQRVIDSARGYLAQKWPDIEQRLINNGMSPEVVKLALGDQASEEYQRKMKKSLLSTKMVYMGQASQVDVDIMVRQEAERQNQLRDLTSLVSQRAKGSNDKALDKDINRLVRQVLKSADNLVNFIDIKNDYDKRVEAVGAPVMPDPKFEDQSPLESPAPNAEPETDEPDPEQANHDVIKESLNELHQDKSWMMAAPDRMPAAVSGERSFSIKDGKFSVDNNGQPIPGLSDMWNQRYQELKGKHKDAPLKDQAEGMKSIYEDAEKRDRLQGPLWNLDAIIKDAEKRGEDPHEAVKKAYEELHKNIAQTGKQDRIPAGVRK